MITAERKHIPTKARKLQHDFDLSN